MKKTVSYDDYSKALRDFRRSVRGKFGHMIEFCEMNAVAAWGEEQELVQIGVNWAALGTVTPDEAAAFGKTLAEAAELARSFKYNGYEVVFD